MIAKTPAEFADKYFIADLAVMGLGANPELITRVETGIARDMAANAANLVPGATVWSGEPDQAIYIWPTNEQVQLRSAEVGDTSKLILVEGCGSEGCYQRLSVMTDAVDGTTPVVLPGTWTDISNTQFIGEGDITGKIYTEQLTANGSNIFSVILPRLNKASNASVYVPLDKWAVFRSVDQSINKAPINQECIYEFWASVPGWPAFLAYQNGLQTPGTTTHHQRILATRVLSPGSTLSLRAVVPGITTVSGQLDIVYVDASLVSEEFKTNFFKVTEVV